MKKMGVANNLTILEKSPLGMLSTSASIVKQFMESKEDFSSRGGAGGAMAFIWLMNLIITFFSFFLAFRCIGKGGDAFGHLAGACCCGILYIAYALASGC